MAAIEDGEYAFIETFYDLDELSAYLHGRAEGVIQGIKIVQSRVKE